MFTCMDGIIDQMVKDWGNTIYYDSKVLYNPDYKNVKEDDKITHYFKFPGVEKEAISVSIVDEGVKVEVKFSDDDPFGRTDFECTIYLSKNADIENIVSEYHKGMLIITEPFKEKEKRIIEIK